MSQVIDAKKVANNGVEFRSHSLTNEYAEPCMQHASN